MQEGPSKSFQSFLQPFSWQVYQFAHKASCHISQGRGKWLRPISCPLFHRRPFHFYSQKSSLKVKDSFKLVVFPLYLSVHPKPSKAFKIPQRCRQERDAHSSIYQDPFSLQQMAWVRVWFEDWLSPKYILSLLCPAAKYCKLSRKKQLN